MLRRFFLSDRRKGWPSEKGFGNSQDFLQSKLGIVVARIEKMRSVRENIDDEHFVGFFQSRESQKETKKDIVIFVRNPLDDFLRYMTRHKVRRIKAKFSQLKTCPVSDVEPGKKQK